MDLELQGKVAVVTGASKGIGLAVVKALVAEGARVVAGARHVEGELAALAKQGDVRPVAVDLARPEAPQQLVARAAELGGLDILVNNVGILTPRLGGFASVTDEQWLASLNLNLLAAVRAARAALPLLLERGGGSIVNVSSVNAFLPDPAIIDYTVSKAGLTNFSKALSKEVGGKNIRVNTVSPGPVATDLWLGPDGVAATVGKAMGVDKETARQRVVESQGGLATGRFTRPEEVADLVLFLASKRAGNITGSDFVIDGGLIKTL
jgi:NAD(P)-dependent dehydrogenase (short-subunit alcohol dehydrogenase family)